MPTLYSVEYELVKQSEELTEDEKKEFLESQKDLITHTIADTFYDAVKKALTTENKFVRLRNVTPITHHANIKN